MELPSSTFVFNGEEIEAFPLIEVKWFERGQEIRDRFAKAITTSVMDFGLPEVEVVLQFSQNQRIILTGSIVQVRSIRKIFVTFIRGEPHHYQGNKTKSPKRKRRYSF